MRLSIAVFAVLAAVLAGCDTSPSPEIADGEQSPGRTLAPEETTPSPEIADWEPAPAETLTAETQTVEILVHERACASGDTAEGRITEPDVDYRDDAVVVTIRVQPKSGVQECPANPTTPYTLQLKEPLGDRELLEGTEQGSEPPDADV